jgi:chaperonin cofactor prefoldin
MDIALVIVGGLAVMTLVAAGFDYLVKRSKAVDKATKAKVEDLELRLKEIEVAQAAKDERIAQLEQEVGFVNKLLEKK